MSGRPGGHKSLYFPPAPAAELPRLATPVAQQNPIIIHGNLLRNHTLLGLTLYGLHLDEQRLHGSPQVILSALRRMEASVESLLNREESQ